MEIRVQVLEYSSVGLILYYIIALESHMLLGELDQNECRRDDAALCGALSLRGESEKERETLKPKIPGGP